MMDKDYVNELTTHKLQRPSEITTAVQSSATSTATAVAGKGNNGDKKVTDDVAEDVGASSSGAVGGVNGAVKKLSSSECKSQIFIGCSVCSTGFGLQERASIERQVKENGGEFSPVMKYKWTTHLIVSSSAPTGG